MKRTLTVGVTGRRHIVPDSRLQIERVTRLFMTRLGTADFEQVIVCSGLAVGADTLVAQAALAEKEREPKTKLWLRAVLPMPLEEYLNDFRQEERGEFRAILERCDEIVELPLVADERGAFERMAQYVKLRDYLVAESDLLLAYWSGNASIVKPGGTVDVVLSKTRAFMGGQSGAIISVATPELQRIKSKDGGKIYVPEKLADPGRCSLSLFGHAEELLTPEIIRLLALADA